MQVGAGLNLRRTPQSLTEWADSASRLEAAWDEHPGLRGILKSQEPAAALHFVSTNPTSRGLSWKSFGPDDHDGWLYGRLDAGSRFTGDDIAYVYADFKLALVGRFDDEVMTAARETRITACRLL